MEQNESLRAFRERAKDWIDKNFPASLRTEEAENKFYRHHPYYPSEPEFLLWKQRMAQVGWNAADYPREYGGGGLSRAQAEIVDDELDNIAAFKPAANQGLLLLAPILLEYGTEQQKRDYLKPILSGDLLFCQGFSEPGAGSDLAALRTKAEPVGDDYVVNGAKVWTSGSMWADWCFCLVRTDKPKQGGISFLLIDLRSKGIDIRPIKLITDQVLFSEITFTDVVVPTHNLIGKPNEGWNIAKRLLSYERSGSRRHRRHLASDERPLHVIARDYQLTGPDGRIRNADLRTRVLRNAILLEAKDCLANEVSALRAAGQGPSAHGSVLKNVTASLTQQREELLVEIMGHQGIGWSGEQFSRNELDSVKAMLSNKAMSIFAGTHEVQNNIISKRILGLPDHK